jgi:hypothetical protein
MWTVWLHAHLQHGLRMIINTRFGNFELGDGQMHAVWLALQYASRALLPVPLQALFRACVRGWARH